MEFNIGDYVTRNSYNNDTIFRIIEINKDKVILKGVDIRLFADSDYSDLVKCEYKNNDEDFDDTILVRDNLDRSEYFYLPAKILHVDAVYFDN